MLVLQPSERQVDDGTHRSQYTKQSVLLAHLPCLAGGGVVLMTLLVLNDIVEKKEDKAAENAVEMRVTKEKKKKESKKAQKKKAKPKKARAKPHHHRHSRKRLAVSVLTFLASVNSILASSTATSSRTTKPT